MMNIREGRPMQMWAPDEKANGATPRVILSEPDPILPEARFVPQEFDYVRTAIGRFNTIRVTRGCDPLSPRQRSVLFTLVITGLDPENQKIAHEMFGIPKERLSFVNDIARVPVTDIELADELYEAIMSELSSQYREPVGTGHKANSTRNWQIAQMRISGKTYGEIAEACGVSSGTVSGALHRMRVVSEGDE